MSNKGTPLSQSQLERFLSGYGSTILAYDDLPRYSSLLSIFDDQQFPFRVIFLGSDFRQIGHWVLIINRTDRKFEYFDPLGFHPDALNSIMNRDPVLKERRFIHDLCQAQERLDFVNVPLQSQKTNNCGRFVIDRILKMKMRNAEYFRLMEAIKTSFGDLDRYVIDALAIPE